MKNIKVTSLTISLLRSLKGNNMLANPKANFIVDVGTHGVAVDVCYN